MHFRLKKKTVTILCLNRKNPMRQRYHEDSSFENVNHVSEVIAHDIAVKFNPPILYLFYLDVQTGKERRRKMPIREFNFNERSKTTHDIAKNLVERHKIVSIVSKVRVHLHILEPENQDENNLKAVDLPSLPQKLQPHLSSDLLAKKLYEPRPLELDGNLDLNKLDDDTILKFKNEMNTDFEKNRVTPNDPEFKYDVQKNFELGNEDNEWDESSTYSNPNNKIQSGNFSLKLLQQPSANIEVDNSSIIDEISAFNEEISEILEEKNSPHTRGELNASNTNLNENNTEEESAKVSSTAFWWMKEGDTVSSKSNISTIPSRPNPENRVTENASTSKTLTPTVLSGLNVSLGAHQKSQELLLKPAFDSTPEELGVTVSLPAPQLLSSIAAKLGPLPSLSKLPGLVSVPKPVVSLQPLSAKDPESAIKSEIATMSVTNASKGQFGKQTPIQDDTILDIGDEDIDAGFSKYDADLEDERVDFLDLIISGRKKSNEPLLPFTNPKNKNSVALSEIIVPESKTEDYVHINSFVMTMKNQVEEPQLVAKKMLVPTIRSIKNDSKPIIIESSYPIPEPKTFKVEETEKKISQIFIAKTHEECKSPDFSTPSKLYPASDDSDVKNIPDMAKTTTTSLQLLENQDDIIIDEEFEDFVVDADNDDEDLSFLTKFAKKPETVPNLNEDPFKPLVLQTTQKNSNITTAAATDDQLKPSSLLGLLPSLSLNSKSKQLSERLDATNTEEKERRDNFGDNLSDDLDFDNASISDLLDDGKSQQNEAAVAAAGSKTSTTNFAYVKNKANPIVNHSDLLDKFAEGAMKILLDETEDTKPITRDHTDTYGAGDTDSENGGGDSTSKVSALENQSPPRNIKFQESSEDEIEDNLFRDDDISLEVDDSVDLENDEF
ncbi:Centrosomal protein of 19 kDa [Physocladia obscura]|uniref:Centrosomal protein of 19 kDa n=1 Tax=Physocladia obscura TaxID=109957 RepID=A0AAD5XHT3_9FUNG|nr:Centrosomal protein of 19 kDa [Physocladia obscura]